MIQLNFVYDILLFYNLYITLFIKYSIALYACI